MLPGSERARVLEQRGAYLASQVVQQMYQNPFWEDRFADRGRLHAEQDAQFHIKYLVTAFELGSSSVLVEYSTWLRGILTNRGMCARHLDRNFELLQQAITADPELDDHSFSEECLQRAREALIYSDESCARIQHSDLELGERSHALLESRGHPADIPGLSTVPDLQYLFSFIADAMANSDAEIFGKHVAWMRAFAVRSGRATETVDTILDALIDSASTLSRDDADRVREIVDAARQHRGGSER